MRPPETIKTSRLCLRPPTMEDAEAIFSRYAQDEAVTKYMTWHPHQSIEETRDYLRSCVEKWQRGSGFPWAITLKESQELIGMVEIRIDGFMADIGYVLASDYWGRGYMPEAVKAVVDWGLAQDGIFRVWAICDVENSASARVMEKSGMQREGLLRRRALHPNLSDEPRDAYVYAIVR